MKNVLKGLAVVLGAVLLVPTTTKAQDEFTVSGKADFVSNYVWRGMDQNTRFAIQPNLGLSYKGLTLAAWGSQSLTHDQFEFDINLSYSVKGFTIMVSDLWWGGANEPYGYYEKEGTPANGVDGGHHFEGTLNYNFSECCNLPLNISWSTWFAGADVTDSEGDRCFSTYINLAYDVALAADITLTPSIGFTPWNGYYNTNDGGFSCTDISLKASKSIAVTKKFSIPLFVQAIASPVNDRTYFVAGFSLGF